jgi:hypothetical protein
MGANSSAAQAQINQAQQNAATTNALTQQITSAYANPNLIAGNQNYAAAVQQAQKAQLSGQQQAASRNLNFALDRSGQAGGSVAADQNASLQKSYVNGLLQASQGAQGAEANLVQSQQGQKDALLGLSGQSGTTGQVATALSGASAAGAGTSNSYGGANALGNVFQTAAQFYNNEQTQAASRQAQSSPWGSFYGANGQ